MAPEQGVYYRDFHDEHGAPRLARCAILFIDLLGVKALARSPEAGQYLVTLDRALNDSRDFLLADSRWPAAYFSDSLVMVTPLAAPDDPSAVASLLTQAAWLQLGLSQHGFALRGGLCIGDVHLSRNLLFGPGLIDAWQLEDQRAKEPRIVLSAEAVSNMEKAYGGYEDRTQAPQTWELLIDQDREVVIDYLTASIVDFVVDPAEDGLRQHRDLIVRRLAEHERDTSVWQKFIWAAQYHNWVCRRLFRGRRDLQIPGVGSRRFRPFVPGASSTS
jgi:hypothetical protein